jgi:23S rRNA (adenine2030-N6)-methyltransferase
VSSKDSRYRSDAAPDYSHRFHAGNVGDVWKHCVLVEVLSEMGPTRAPVTFVETHAGEGSYALGPTGEWTEGIGKLWSDAACAARADALGQYLRICREHASERERPERYPGSPTIARSVLGPTARLVLWERDSSACERLALGLQGDRETRVACGDGLAAAEEEIRTAESQGHRVVALIDPTYGQKSDWLSVPDALARLVRSSERACLVLWYPVKSHTRPNAMIARLQSAGVSATIAELITTPLEHKRSRLNGSALLLVRPPARGLEAIAALAPSIGRRCATHAGEWSFRIQSWVATDQALSSRRGTTRTVL